MGACALLGLGICLLISNNASMPRDPKDLGLTWWNGLASLGPVGPGLCGLLKCQDGALAGASRGAFQLSYHLLVIQKDVQILCVGSLGAAPGGFQSLSGCSGLCVKNVVFRKAEEAPHRLLFLCTPVSIPRPGHCRLGCRSRWRNMVIWNWFSVIPTRTVIEMLLLGYNSRSYLKD